ncbi:hypothetical protein C7V10_04190 [Elizabethkingia miricola]|nr:hypothetical protein C7V10_04190 [Elizabethkingia miricola]
MCQVDYWLQVVSSGLKIGRLFFRIRNFGRKNENAILRSEPERHKSARGFIHNISSGYKNINARNAKAFHSAKI